MGRYAVRSERMTKRERFGERGRETQNTMVSENSVGKWHGLILTVGLNQQHLRMFAEGVSQIEQ